MAPELFEATRGGKVRFTEAADTYAFGATALALVLGRLPKDMREMPPNLPSAAADFTTLPIGLPHEVGELLNRCLEADASARPAMRDVAQLLGLHLPS